MSALLPRLAVGAAALVVLSSVAVRAQESVTPSGTASATKVGPTRGAVVVVGGGQLGPEIYARFIALAGGPDALIVDVPTAGGDSVYPPDWQGTRALKAAGARHVVVLHTVDPSVADADSFVAPLHRAGGVWFEGGRQWHLVDSYAGTRTERAFHDVLARGGVVGGSSAGASILASYLLRGARSGNTVIMAPGYETGFGFLRGVAIDQHVVARARLADLADSLMPRHPELLGISEDEGTAWVVQGDSAEIIGRSKAFVYGGTDPTDPGKPLLTLYPGDRYDLATRRVIHRASADSPVRAAFVDSLLASLSADSGAEATVLVAEHGEVLIDRSYGVPAQAKYMPTTTIPNFPLGGISRTFQAATALLLERDGKLKLDDPLTPDGSVSVRQYLAHRRSVPEGDRLFSDLVVRRSGGSFSQFVSHRLFTPIGAHRTTVAEDGTLASNVDELYRWELGIESHRSFTSDSLNEALAAAGRLTGGALGWRIDRYRGLRRAAAYGTDAGMRNAMVRIPERGATIIVLTNRDDVNAGAIADRITDRLLFP